MCLGAKGKGEWNIKISGLDWSIERALIDMPNEGYKEW